MADEQPVDIPAGIEQNGKDKENISLSVFFPCYNEQDSLPSTAEHALDVLGKLGIDYELIIVNDGSSDATAEIADRIAGDNPSVKVIHHKINLGYGTALQSGFRAATKQLVFYTDGDGQFDISEMPALLPLTEQYDIVSCYRLNRQDGFLRKLNAWCWNRLVCFLFDMKVKDIDCAFKLYKRKIFDDMELCSTGALIDTEVLARALRKGYSITQKGVRHYPRKAGEQTGANLKVIFRAFRELFALHSQIKKQL